VSGIVSSDTRGRVRRLIPSLTGVSVYLILFFRMAPHLPNSDSVWMLLSLAFGLLLLSFALVVVPLSEVLVR